MPIMKTLTLGGKVYEVTDDAARTQLNGKVNNSGWAANKIIGTDSSGNIVAKNASDMPLPVRGTDYWTAADIAEIKGYVDNAILNGAW